MRAFLCLVFAAILAASPAAAQQTENERLVAYFDYVVFGNEFAGRALPTVRKWTEPIRYKFASNNAAITKYRPVVQAHFASLAQFTNLSFQEIGPRDPGENFIIGFAPLAGLVAYGRTLAANPAEVAGRQFETASCFFLSYIQDGRLVAARVLAGSDLPDQELVHCLLEELAQSLGLPNDDDRVAPSIFNDSLHLTSLSLIDKVLLRLVYDPRMRPGTPRAQALQLARAILAELNPGGG